MKKTLTTYRKKRDFTKTREPTGRQKSTQKDLVFVVQYHAARRLHYDFRFAYQGVLLSWAVPKGPSFNPANKRLAVQVEDHPLAYQHFEGVIPEGSYGAGTVMIWDQGPYQMVNDFIDGLKKGSLEFILFGKRLNGKWRLVRTDAIKKEWLLLKSRDQYAKEDYPLAQFTTSITSGKTMAEITSDAR